MRQLALLTLLAASVVGGPVGAAEDGGASGEEILLGEVTRQEVEERHPDWVMAEVEAEIDPETARALADVRPGAEVVVYFGSWCSDSRRELGRFWRAVDEIGGEPPFPVEYVGVARAADRPPELSQEVGLEYVPTFVVLRDGAEVGRVVEESPTGIERDLLALLTGEVTGVVSAREELGGGE